MKSLMKLNTWQPYELIHAERLMALQRQHVKNVQELVRATKHGSFCCCLLLLLLSL